MAFEEGAGSRWMGRKAEEEFVLEARATTTTPRAAGWGRRAGQSLC